MGEEMTQALYAHMNNKTIKNKKWATELNNFFKGRNTNSRKTHEKILTIPGHKGNANQNHTKIPPHPC
jgi:hypothetical protein